MFTKSIIKTFSLLIVVFIGLSVIFMFFASINSKEIKTDLLDHYGSFIGGIFGTLLSFLSIILVVYSFYDSKEKERIEKQSFEKDKLKYFSSLLNNTVNTVEEQIKRLNTFCDEITQDPVRFPLLHSFSFNDLDRLVYKINQEEHFHAYLNQIGDNCIYAIFSNLDFLEASIKQLLDMQAKAVEYDRNRKLELKFTIDNLMNKVGRYLSAIKKETLQSYELYIKLNQIMIDYHIILKEDNTDFKRIHEKVIMKIVVFVLDYENTNEYLSISTRLQDNFKDIKYEAGHKANKLLHPIMRHNVEHQQTLRQISISLKEALGELQDKKKTLDDFIKTQIMSN